MNAVIDRISARASSRAKDEAAATQFVSVFEVVEAITNELNRTNKDLITQITLKAVPESALEMAIVKIINKYNYGIVGKDRDELIKEIKDNVFRHGIIQNLLDISECNGVFINGYDNVWAKIGNRMVKTDINFGSNNNLLSYIYTIKAKLRGEINENSPLATFEDHVQKLRIVCCIAPVSLYTHTVVFRKHSEEGFNIDDLVKIGMLTRELADDLIAFSQAGANIIVSGKGGAGKTTLMRALLEALDIRTRILTLEEQAEFFLKHPNAVQLLTKRSDSGKTINLNDLSDLGNKMSIDRYVYGEIRSGEAMAFFNGAFSGNVSMTSIHAMTSKLAIKKAMVMMKMSGTNLSDAVLLDMLYDSTDIIIHVDSFVATEVVEVVKTEEEVIYNTLWHFDIKKRDVTFLEGEHKRVGKIKGGTMLNKLSTWKGAKYYAS